MSAVEKLSDHMPASMPVPQTTSANQLLAVLSRMMADPSVDVDRIERGAALYERAIARDAEQAFFEAMNAAQAELRPIAADADNSQTRSKYATYAALDAKARPIYTKHGFCLSFNSGEGAAEDCIRVICDVARGAHSRRYHIDMPADGKGAKGGDVMSKTHATGAAMTYGRRYLLGMIFNLVIGDDNDGNDASAAGSARATAPAKPGAISHAQAAAIRSAMASRSVSPAAFLHWAKVARIEDTPIEHFDSCIAAINKFKPKAIT